MTNDKFAVVLPSAQLDNTGFYKKGLMDKIINKYPWLTVAGLDEPSYLQSGRALRGVEFAGAGNVITFGTAKSHNVNWIERADYAREKGIAPVYDLIKDWNTVVSKLDAFAIARKPAPAYRNTCYGCSGCSYYNSQPTGSKFYVGGQLVEVFDGFIKIGYNIIPRTASVSSFYGFTPAQLRTVESVIITIKNLY